jgi:hypothetical protein
MSSKSLEAVRKRSQMPQSKRRKETMVRLLLKLKPDKSKKCRRRLKEKSELRKRRKDKGRRKKRSSKGS